MCVCMCILKPGVNMRRMARTRCTRASVHALTWIMLFIRHFHLTPHKDALCCCVCPDRHSCGCCVLPLLELLLLELVLLLLRQHPAPFVSSSSSSGTRQVRARARSDMCTLHEMSARACAFRSANILYIHTHVGRRRRRNALSRCWARVRATIRS